MANHTDNATGQDPIVPVFKMKLADREVLNFFKKRCRFGKRSRRFRKLPVVWMSIAQLPYVT